MRLTITPWIFAPMLLALVSACTAPGEPGASNSSSRAASVTGPVMIPSGEPRNCVNTNQIRQTVVRDDRTIDFILMDGTVLRNTLPNRCPGLGFERAFSYSTSINQLCNVDIITVLNPGGGNVRGASCGLGMFVPVKPAEPAAAG